MQIVDCYEQNVLLNGRLKLTEKQYTGSCFIQHLKRAAAVMTVVLQYIESDKAFLNKQCRIVITLF
jgi:hypothetical protein